MSDYNGEEQQFDLNDPDLVIDVPEGYDPEGDLVAASFAPPKDGPNRVAIFLAEDTEAKRAVRFSKGKVVASFRVRAVKDDGSLGQFLKDWYPTSQVFEGQVTSALATLCKLVGAPVRTTQPGAYIAHVEGLFKGTRDEGSEGFRLTARTQWVKSVPDGSGGYTETKGMGRIAQAAVAAALHRAHELGWDEDQTAAAVAYAQANPHLYYDESGEERSVRAEVRAIVGA